MLLPVAGATDRRSFCAMVRICPNSLYSGAIYPLIGSSLTLFMFWVDANHHYPAPALYDFTLLTHGFN